MAGHNEQHLTLTNRWSAWAHQLQHTALSGRLFLQCCGKCFSLPSCVWTLGRVRSCNCGGHWCGCHPVCSHWCCCLHCNASHFMPTMEKHVSIVPIWLKQEVVDLLINDQLLHYSSFLSLFSSQNNLWVNGFGCYKTIHVHISMPHDRYLLLMQPDSISVGLKHNLTLSLWCKPKLIRLLQKISFLIVDKLSSV